MIRRPSLSLDQVEKLEKSGVLFAEAEEVGEKRDAPKEFVPQKRANGLWGVRLTAGGEVPKKLSGTYTTVDKAEVAIYHYLNERG